MLTALVASAAIPRKYMESVAIDTPQYECIRLKEQETIAVLAVVLILPLLCGYWFYPEATAEQNYRYEIDINTATAAEWQTLDGIGPKLAEAITAYRTNKPFHNISELKNVKGIGEKKFQAVKPFLRELHP
ncbi:hypothetical protein FACS1894170_08870 [Planctomycetales bacterium]|nr:hypothetical protein FACS1894170_08870 [Planctomycetales bacterium]